MRSVVGDHSVNEVLTTGRQQVATEAKESLQQLADRYDAGVDIQQVVLQDVNPPDPVKPSFNEVNQAIQEKERAINEAQAELNKAIPRARGESEQIIRAAEGYAIERVNRARGEAPLHARSTTSTGRAPTSPAAACTSRRWPTCCRAPGRRYHRRGREGHDADPPHGPGRRRATSPTAAAAASVKGMPR